ncbi:hypothetical protein NMD85_09945 [Edwardsiella tarda]
MLRVVKAVMAVRGNAILGDNLMILNTGDGAKIAGGNGGAAGYGGFSATAQGEWR